MDKKTYTPAPINDRPLTTNEAKWVADFLEKRIGDKLPRGYAAIFKLRPSVIARKYQVEISDILSFARRTETEELA